MSTFDSAARALLDLRNNTVDEAKKKTQDVLPVRAKVDRVDTDGMVYVIVDGRAVAEGPYPKTVMVKGGDHVSLEIKNGEWTVVDNYDDPGASGTYVRQETGEVVMRVDEIRADVGKFDDVYASSVNTSVLIADNATVEQITAAKAYADTVGARIVTATEGQFDDVKTRSLESETGTFDYIRVEGQIVANIGVIDHAELKTLNADVATFGSIGSKYADIGFANVKGANIDMAKMQELFAASGWFNKLVVTGDADITGQLVAVEIDGDTARFKNIYADALKLLGTDGLYRALNLVGLSDGEQQAMISDYAEDLEDGLHGSRIIAETITADQINVTSLVARMLLTQGVQIGATGGVHIKSVGNRFSFFLPGIDYTDAQMEAAGTSALEGEVAFISVQGNESLFYMNNAMVLDDLRFGGGNWQWKARENGNLMLKWRGASS